MITEVKVNKAKRALGRFTVALMGGVLITALFFFFGAIGSYWNDKFPSEPPTTSYISLIFLGLLLTILFILAVVILFFIVKGLKYFLWDDWE